jgi:hypothetical protein
MDGNPRKEEKDIASTPYSNRQKPSNVEQTYLTHEDKTCHTVERDFDLILGSGPGTLLLGIQKMHSSFEL